MLSSADKLIAAQKMKSLSANIAGQLCMPEIDVVRWLNKVVSLLTEFCDRYGNRQFAIILSKDSLNSSQPISLELLWDLVSRGIECFTLDFNLQIGLSDNTSSEIEILSEFCKLNEVPALLVSGEETSLYDINGRSIFFYNILYPDVERRRRHGLTARSCRQYKTIVEEQSSRQLVTCMDEIWHDRNRRILVGNRKTEKVLQRLLAKWLYENIYDARISSEVGKISGVDRTDIEISGFNTGDNFIVEVKWLGRNSSNSNYDIDRLKEGIEQVCTYLEREPTALEGCVVCYDGRQENERANLFSLDEPIARLDYRIVWLESRSASDVGD